MAPRAQGETVVAVTSGANMNFDRLRLVSELAQVGARREAMLATTIPEVASAPLLPFGCPLSA
jgi:threonine dehydratase